MLKRLFVVLALSLLGLTSCTSTTPAAPQAERGVMNLRQWDFERDGPVALAGEWEFHWQALLTPEQLAGSQSPIPAGYFPVPALWPTYRLPDQALPAQGYATYRLTLFLPNSSQVYGLRLAGIETTYQVWADQRLVAASGVIGTQLTATVPYNTPHFAQITPRTNAISLVIEVANFMPRPGGMGQAIYLGTLQQIQTEFTRQEALEFFQITLLLSIGLYYLVLYSLRPQEAWALSFGLFNIAMAIYSSTVQTVVLGRLWPTLSWETLTQFREIAIPLVGWAFFTFLATLYPQATAPLLTRGVALISSGLILLAIGLPSALHQQWVAPLSNFWLYLLVLGLIGLLGSIGYNYRRQSWGTLALVSPLMVAGLWDLVAQLGWVPPLNLVAWATQLLIVGEVFLLLRRLMRAYAATERFAGQVEHLNQAYSRFVPREFLRLLGSADITQITLGDQTQREMTVLFADVRNFSALAEHQTPSDSFRFVNKLFGLLSPVVREHGGFVDKYLGDGFMALFPQSASSAMQAALSLQKALATFNATLSMPIQMGMGLHFGPLVLGTVGEPERMDGTVIADAVNTSARLEMLTKRFGATIILSEAVLQALPTPPLTRRLGTVRAKGKQQPLAIYEVLTGLPPTELERKQATLTTFEAGLGHYQAAAFAAAQACFQQVVRTHPQDLAAGYYLEQAAYYAQHGTLLHWDGVENLAEK